MALRIEDYALIGDTHTAALVGSERLDRLALPAPLRLGRVLRRRCSAPTSTASGDIAPAGEVRRAARRYRGRHAGLETDSRPRTERSGSSTACRRDGRTRGWCAMVEGLRGRSPMRTQLEPRFDYGRTGPWVRRSDGAIAAIAGPGRARAPQRRPARAATTCARRPSSRSRAGQRVGVRPDLVRVVGAAAPRRSTPVRAVDETEAWWREWAGALDLPRAAGRDEVERSLITLKALTYAPTGGIVAAPTTSLPEFLGGVRNWDYRYCWLRDATFTLDALMAAGYVDEAARWRDWLLRAVAGDPEDLQIMYGIGGRAAARRVRAGAGCPATRARVRCASATRRRASSSSTCTARSSTRCTGRSELGHARPTPHAWSVQRRLIDWLEAHWREPDEGIWEVRGPAAALRALEGDGVGRRRPRRSQLVGGVRARRAARALRADARRDPRRGVPRGLRPRAQHVHAVLRIEGAGRVAAADPAGRLPARRPTRAWSAPSRRSSAS